MMNEHDIELEERSGDLENLRQTLFAEYPNYTRLIDGIIKYGEFQESQHGNQSEGAVRHRERILKEIADEKRSLLATTEDSDIPEVEKIIKEASKLVKGLDRLGLN